jgi:hypothetical protein
MNAPPLIKYYGFFLELFLKHLWRDTTDHDAGLIALVPAKQLAELASAAGALGKERLGLSAAGCN